jgi:hypothetical protein
MKNALVKRRAVMAMTLAITVWLAAQAENPGDDSVIQLAHSHQNTSDPVKIAGASAGTPVATPNSPLPVDSTSLDWKALAGRTLPVDGATDHSADLFKSHDWHAASKALEPAAPPPPPLAPAAPFSYMGKLENTPKGTTFFLSGNNRVYAVIAGQNIDDTWRLDAETDTSLNLTYLPLRQSQALAKTATSAASAEDESQGAN